MSLCIVVQKNPAYYIFITKEQQQLKQNAAWELQREEKEINEKATKLGNERGWG